MKNKISLKNIKIICYSVIGICTIGGLAAFAEETSHYLNYINIEKTYHYYEQGSLEIDYKETKSFNDFLFSFTNNGYSSYVTSSTSYLNNLEANAKKVFENNQTEFNSFNESYIEPSKSFISKTTQVEPRIYGFALGIVLFVFGLGSLASLYFSREKKKIKKKD